jgi:hypothetical protein
MHCETSVTPQLRARTAVDSEPVDGHWKINTGPVVCWRVGEQRAQHHLKATVEEHGVKQIVLEVYF